MISEMSIFEDLIGGMPQGQILPSLRFFEPRKSFISYMVSRPAATVYDVGAGDGFASHQLRNAGVDARPIDLNYRSGRKYPVEIANAVEYDYEPQSYLMFCRPCHGPWVEVTIHYALRQGVAGFIYVGLRKNFEDDLGEYASRFKRVMTNAGKDRESVWIYECQ